MSFIESPRFPESALQGATGGPLFNNDVAVFGSGKVSVNKTWSTPLQQYSWSFTDAPNSIATIRDFFMAMSGNIHSFRLKDWNDYRSGLPENTPLATDQVIGSGDGSTVSYQLKKTYTVDSVSQERTINKPVAGTVLAAIAGKADTSFTEDSTTGIITFANEANTVTAISQAVQAVVTVGTTPHNILPGQTLYIDGVAGMVEINKLRGVVQSVTTNTITLDIDSTGFTAYSFGGTTATLPQTGESVTAGYEFDVPVRFSDQQLPIQYISYNLQSVNINLSEVRI